MPKLKGGSSRRAQNLKAREATKLYLDLERRLARLGFPRPSFRTPDEHAEKMRMGGVPIAEPVALITRRYNAVRFGRDNFAADETDQLRRLIRSLQLNRN